MKIFNNLRFRLLLLVALAVIPALGVTLYSGIEQRQDARNDAVRSAFRSIRSVANYHETIVEGIHQTMRVLSLSPELRNPQTCGSFLAGIDAANLFSDLILVVDNSGEVYCSSSKATLSLDLAETSYFQKAVESGEFTIGEPLVYSEVDTYYLPLLLPVSSANAAENFVLLTMLDLTLMAENETIYNLPAQSAILVIDDTGQVLMRHPETEVWVGQRLPNAPVIQQILAQGHEGSTEAQGIDNIMRFYAFIPFTSGEDHSTYLSVGIPSETVYASANRIVTQSLLLIGLSSLLAMLTAWFGGEFLFLRVVSLTAERDEAERRLRDSNLRLEVRVAERTAELADVNQKLQNELEERKRTVILLRAREGELNRLLHLLERSNRDLQDFAYITSHDLQEPLRKIQAFGDRLAHRYHDQIDQEGVMYINRMTTSARRMQNMINDLLQYSRVSTRGGNFVMISLKGIIEEVLQDLELRVRETGGVVKVGELPEIEADPVQMRQLFQNLIGNSLKFHRDGVPPVINISSKIVQNGPGDENKQVQLCVEDNGIGFEDKYIDRIFQPFQRLHSKDTYEGSGIGLAVCRKIANRHGGDITAQSIPDQGSQFFITLSVYHQEEESEKA
jgi:signal transduction histidine kinase